MPSLFTKGKDMALQTREERKVSNEKKLREMWERDSQKVKGIFRFYECEGATLDFTLRLYKWDDIETYSLTDGQIYEIPLKVAKHLNNNGWYPEHKLSTDENGIPRPIVGHKKRRFGFQSLEFVDDSEYRDASPIIVSPETGSAKSLKAN